MVSHSNKLLTSQTLESVYPVIYHGLSTSRSLLRMPTKLLASLREYVGTYTTPTPRRFLYCSLVRPKLEYASNVWSPNTIKYRSIIENVQRRATKFILNYPKDMSYPERLVETNLLPLEFRKMGLIYMDINKYLSTHEPGYKSRRNYNVNNFHFVLKHKQNYFSYKIRFLLGRRIYGTISQ